MIRLAVCIASYVAAALFGIRALGALILWQIGQNGGVITTPDAAYTFGVTGGQWPTAADVGMVALPCLVMLAIGVYCTVHILQEKKREKKERT